ncbi:nucleotidyltransferase family protein [Hymenobacter sp. BT175]|uniref:nucleotidyltransferase family protein n=1 Tax=Hymenobacter translucens TaxID=2886507 RepID=UPI001D0E73C2|nr:nucleotidyltransferase family protein [Hymenobacter translucens]MCC2545331.1 nucleotidyltransferase family protein [Hymenobacter translucens]
MPGQLSAPAPVGIIVLAAGASTRMGQPKQLLRYQDKTLLRHAAETALAAACGSVVVVTGAEHDSLAAEVGSLPVLIAHNPRWEQGMSTSIQAGLTVLEAAAPVSAVLVMLTDQPLVTTELLQELVRQHRQSGAPRVATRYADTVGVPAVFGREQFAALRALQGPAGARHLLTAGSPVVSVPFEAAATDVDTPAQYLALLGKPAGPD